MFYRRKKTQDTYFFAKLWMIILLVIFFFKQKRLERNTVLRKKNDYYTILNAFFSEGQKLDSLVWYDLGGPTNYVKIRISVVIVMLSVF